MNITYEKPLVTSLKMTCSACPSQWEGYTEDGRFVYIRYRYGGLGVDIAPSEPEWCAGNRETILFKELGGALDGVLSTEDMIRATRGVIRFSDEAAAAAWCVDWVE